MPKQTHNTSHLPEYGINAAFEQFQQREQAQFRRPREHYAGSNTAVSAPSPEQPTYARQPPHTAYARYASNRYRPSGRSGRTSSLRNEVLNNEEDHSSYPAFGNQGSSPSFAPSGNTGYHALDLSQQSRQQSAWSRNGAYEGAYGDRNIGQANSSTTAYQQSPYLLPNQKPHDVNNPPPAFHTRSPAPHSNYAIHSAPQEYPNMENARPQSNSNRTGGVDNPVQLSDEAEELEEPRKQTNKKKKGPPTERCATLKKTIHKQGETKVVKGELMWSDPNEPEDQKWSELQPQQRHESISF